MPVMTKLEEMELVAEIRKRIAAGVADQREADRRDQQRRQERTSDELAGDLSKLSPRSPEFQKARKANLAKLQTEEPFAGITTDTQGAVDWEATRIKLTETLESLIADTGQGTGIRNAIDRSEAKAVRAELNAHLKTKPGRVVNPPPPAGDE